MCSKYILKIIWEFLNKNCEKGKGNGKKDRKKERKQEYLVLYKLDAVTLLRDLQRNVFASEFLLCYLISYSDLELWRISEPVVANETGSQNRTRSQISNNIPRILRMRRFMRGKLRELQILSPRFPIVGQRQFAVFTFCPAMKKTLKISPF